MIVKCIPTEWLSFGPFHNNGGHFTNILHCGDFVHFKTRFRGKNGAVLLGYRKAGRSISTEGLVAASPIQAVAKMDNAEKLSEHAGEKGKIELLRQLIHRIKIAMLRLPVLVVGPWMIVRSNVPVIVLLIVELAVLAAAADL